jgi:nucleoside-diphosphate-sugar epimerase
VLQSLLNKGVSLDTRYRWFWLCRVGTFEAAFITAVRGQAFTENDAPAPQDPYGQSKHEAELGLRHLAADTGMEVVIIRPPLVYGPGVKANFAALMRAVQRGWPLPLGAVHNQRSLVGVDNLCSCLLQCIVNPQAVGQVFLVSDGHDLSTADLCRNLALSMGRQPALWSIPVHWLKCLAMLPRLGGVLQRLMGSLQVDIHHTRTTLNWSPPVSVQEGLRRAFAQHEKTL